MRFGLSMFITDETMPPSDVGRLAEERGFSSLFIAEHTHIPLDYTRRPGVELGRHYMRSLDPFVALTAVAGATSTLRLGFGICLVVQRDPFTTAKAVASLDLVSGGRVDFGIGAGWNRPEISNHGTPFDRRFRVMRERVEAMRALWTQEEASYSGEFESFGPVWSWPKPLQDPLPVYVGGNGERVLDRVLRYGDHWMPNREIALPERISSLRSRASDAGRPRPLVKYFGCAREEAMAERLLEAGVDEVLLMLPPADGGELERAADEAAAVASRFAS